MKNRKCVYLKDRHIEWLKEMSKINNRSESYFVQLAMDMLMEVINGKE